MTDERRREIISAAKLQWESATFEECCDWAIRTALAEHAREVNPFIQLMDLLPEDKKNEILLDIMKGVQFAVSDESRIRAGVWREAASVCFDHDMTRWEFRKWFLDEAEALLAGNGESGSVSEEVSKTEGFGVDIRSDDTSKERDKERGDG